jgi:Flp pilus assembly protein TadG
MTRWVQKTWGFSATWKEVEGVGMHEAGCKTVSRDTAPGGPRRLLQRFRNDRCGATAVEFAIISIPFFGLLFAIFETAFVFLVSEGLDAATTEAARQLMTGQAQNVSTITTANQFRDSLICNPTPPAQRILPSFIDCSKLIVDVSESTSFATANMSKSFYTDPTTNYNPGGASCIVIVRVVYPMPVYLSIITGHGLAVKDNTAGQTMYDGSMHYMLMSTGVFRNEPFPTSPYPSC